MARELIPCTIEVFTGNECVWTTAEWSDRIQEALRRLRDKFGHHHKVTVTSWYHGKPHHFVSSQRNYVL